jgi:hypothetical protein
MLCCLCCHLPKAICSCVDVSPRKSIGNGAYDTGTAAGTLESIILMRSYFHSNILCPGTLKDTFDDLQAALQALPDSESTAASQDHNTFPLGSDMERGKTDISRDEHCSLVQLSSSSSIILPVPAHADSQLKMNYQGRRPSPKDSCMNAGFGGAPHQARNAVTSVTAFESEISVAEDALATSDATAQVVADDITVDADCSSPVMHREYFSHVRRVNLENLSLVIGSNLPVFQVNFYSQAASIGP